MKNYYQSYNNIIDGDELFYIYVEFGNTYGVLMGCGMLGRR